MRSSSRTPSETPWAALPVLLAGPFMVVLDFFIVNVALPSIGTELGAGLVALVVTTRLVPVPAAADDRRR